MGLDVVGESLETGEALIQVAVNADMTEFPALEAGFMVLKVVMDEGCVMVATGPPDFCASDSNFFFFDQGRQ